MEENKWRYYFPIPNDRNIERLNYRLNELSILLSKGYLGVYAPEWMNPNTCFDPIMDFLGTIPNEVLSYVLIDRAYFPKHADHSEPALVLISSLINRVESKEVVGDINKCTVTLRFILTVNSSIQLRVSVLSSVYRSGILDTDSYHGVVIYNGPITDFDVSSLSSHLGIVNN